MSLEKGQSKMSSQAKLRFKDHGGDVVASRLDWDSRFIVAPHMKVLCFRRSEKNPPSLREIKKAFPTFEETLFDCLRIAPDKSVCFGAPPSGVLDSIPLATRVSPKRLELFETTRASHIWFGGEHLLSHAKETMLITDCQSLSLSTGILNSRLIHLAPEKVSTLNVIEETDPLVVDLDEKYPNILMLNWFPV